jgi:endonuclease/exonuclease/phosphatase family metal-dependent hydrolase
MPNDGWPIIYQRFGITNSRADLNSYAGTDPPWASDRSGQINMRGGTTLVRNNARALSDLGVRARHTIADFFGEYSNLSMFHPTVIGTLLLLLSQPGEGLAADYRCRDNAVAPLVFDGRELRVASLNIAHGRGAALNQMLIGRTRIAENLDRAAVVIRDTGAQVVALQELDVDSWWAGNFDHGERVLKTSRLQCITIGLHAQTWLYRFGTGLLSALELSEPQATSFEPTPPTTTKGVIAATLSWRDGQQTRPVRVASVHLDFSRKDARQRQMDAIIKNVIDTPIPVIVMGDFNEQWDTDGSVVRRLVEEGGLVAYMPESQSLHTYKSKRLDWILVSPELEFTSYEVVEDVVSDHRLIVAQLRWRTES